MKKIEPPAQPLASSPVLRGGEVVLADGRIAEKAGHPGLARWTGLKLSILCERYPFEWAQDRAPRVAPVHALIATLARVAKWTRLVSGLTTRGAPTSKPFTKKAFDNAVKRVALQRFNANLPTPLVFARTGAADDLQYEWSLAVSDCHVHVFAYDTPKLAELERGV